MTTDKQPLWLSKFGPSIAPEEVVTAWLAALDPEARKQAEDDPPSARTALRHAIVNARDTSAAVRADAATGWKYTGAVIRAMDAALGVAPVRPTSLFSEGGVDAHAPKQIVAADAAAGTLGLFWSDVYGACRVDLCHANGITHRLNVAAECVKALEGADGGALVTETVPMEDLQHEQIDAEDGGAAAAIIWAEQLRQCIEVLRRWRTVAAAAGTAASAYINCQMGKNRSGAVVAAWLCLEHGWELLAAVEHVRRVSSLALGNPHLNVALAHIVGCDDTNIPLNPAGDDGSWITYSPPGSPKLEASAPDGVAAAAEAAGRLAALAVPEEEVDDEEAEAAGGDGLADLADLLEEL